MLRPYLSYSLSLLCLSISRQTGLSYPVESDGSVKTDFLQRILVILLSSMRYSDTFHVL